MCLKRDTEIRLIEALRAVVESRTPQMAPEEMRLSPSVYVSPERFEAERRALFRRYPIAVAHASALATPGDFLTHDLLGVPILVQRDRDGVLRAFLNVCRHRGSRLVVEEAGSGRKALVCGYHGWTYGLDGALMHIPHPEGFPRTDCDRNLVSLAVSDHAGFIWVVPTPGISLDPTTWFGELSDEIAGFQLGSHVAYRKARLRRRFNWKLMVDAFLDGYHIRQLHRNSVYRFFLDNLSVSDQIGPHMRSIVARKAIENLKDVPREQWDLRDALSLTYFLFPNTILIFHPDWVSLVTLFPVTPSESVFSHTMLVPPGTNTEEMRPHWDKTWDLIHGSVFEREDLLAAEWLQNGAESGANEALSIGRYEFPIALFHRTIEECLAQASAT
jgi:phenylpropionate dioxygenase-like ring-hydroxylating dioxygenase large terminal subunit